jgi:hypothetical protein
MHSNVNLGRDSGIEIKLHCSCFIIAAPIVFSRTRKEDLWQRTRKKGKIRRRSSP